MRRFLRPLFEIKIITIHFSLKRKIITSVYSLNFFELSPPIKNHVSKSTIFFFSLFLSHSKKSLGTPKHRHSISFLSLSEKQTAIFTHTLSLLSFSLETETGSVLSFFPLNLFSHSSPFQEKKLSVHNILSNWDFGSNCCFRVDVVGLTSVPNVIRLRGEILNFNN